MPSHASCVKRSVRAGASCRVEFVDAYPIFVYNDASCGQTIGGVVVTGHDEMQLAKGLPASTAWLFPEYEFESVGLESHSGVIMERLLDRGTWDQVRWLFAAYGEERVATWVQKHGFRLLSKRSFALWRLALDITDFHAPEWAIEAREMEPW